MNITCNVIRDLLPLYAEGLAGDDTVKLVEEHLAACEDCRKALQELRAPVKLSADTDAAPLRRVRSKMQKQKTRAIILTALICLVVATTLFGWLTAPEYLPYSIQTIKLTGHENNILSVRFGDGVTGYDINRFPSETGRGEEYHITAWTSLLGRLTGGSHTREVILNPDGEAVSAAYYYTAYGQDHHWLYGEGDENVVFLPRLFLSYYCIAALALAVLLLSAALLFRRNGKAHRALLYVALMPASYLLAQLCIKGTYTTTYAPIRDLSLIVLAAVPIYGLLFLLISKRLKRKDKLCD